MAVLELVKPVVFSDQVHAICLPSDKAKSPKTGSNAIVAGWGLTEAYGTVLSICHSFKHFQRVEINKYIHSNCAVNRSQSDASDAALYYVVDC